MILLLDTPNLAISSQKSCFMVIDSQNTRLISPKKIEAILLTAKVTVDSSAMMLAFEADVPLYYLDRQGHVKGVCRRSAFCNSTEIRRKQAVFKQNSESVAWVKELLGLKLGGYLQNLRYFVETLPSTSEATNRAIASIHQATLAIRAVKEDELIPVEDYLRGQEGAASRFYWAALSASLPEGYGFENRSKNPAQDAFNAALNYLYGILYTMVESATYSVGLDPQMGVFHADQYQKPSLVFDLIEPFRHWADRFLFDFFREEKPPKSYFKVSDTATYLDKNGKAALIPRFLNFMHARTTFRNRITTRKHHISNFAGELATHLFTL